MTLKPTVIVAALALAACADAPSQSPDNGIDWSGASVPKQFAYSSPELRYVSSRYPIPPAHLRCMKYVDDEIKQEFALLDQSSHNELMVPLYRDAVALVHVDWGISAKEDYPTDAREFAAKIPRDRANVDESRQGLVDQVRQTAGMTAESGYTNPLAASAHAAALGYSNMALVEARDSYISAQYHLVVDSGAAEFFNCVAENNLPSTRP